MIDDHHIHAHPSRSATVPQPFRNRSVMIDDLTHAHAHPFCSATVPSSCIITPIPHPSRSATVPSAWMITHTRTSILFRNRSVIMYHHTHSTPIPFRNRSFSMDDHTHTRTSILFRNRSFIMYHHNTHPIPHPFRQSVKEHFLHIPSFSILPVFRASFRIHIVFFSMIG
ncbi:hypothetical protein BC829DRAFT_9458 [Chytridium lagenaria]|nr:hypothetical protein BC829DRAFT_9458 [Chytridium lagenaria]